MKYHLYVAALGIALTTVLHGANLSAPKSGIELIDEAVIGRSAECFGFRMHPNSLNPLEQARCLLSLYDRLDSALKAEFTVEATTHARISLQIYKITVSQAPPYFIVSFPEGTSDLILEKAFHVIATQNTRYLVDSFMGKMGSLGVEAEVVGKQMEIEADVARLALLKDLAARLGEEMRSPLNSIER